MSARCGDIDRDGKVDVVIAHVEDQNIGVYKNNSTPGSLSFGAGFTYSTGTNPFSSVIADMNLDGKPEIIVANYASKTISILKNQISALAAPVITASNPGVICPGQTTTLSTTTAYSAYLWSTGQTTSSINAGGGIYTVTVTDQNGCQNSASYTVIAGDNISPVFPSLPDVVINNAVGQCYGNNILATPIVTDNCAVQSVTNNAGATFPIGVTMVTWTATDASGNTITASQKVTVVDWQKPIFPTLSDVIINNAVGQCYGNNILATPIVTDNCSMQSLTNNAASTFPIGITIVTWTASDANGNLSTAQQKVTVVDNEKPVITSCPIDTLRCYNAGGTYTIGGLSASDNCGVQSISYTVSGATSRTGNGNNASGTFNPGTSTIAWKVTDVNGNTATCTTTVRIDKVEATIPNAFASGITSSFGLPNTIYIGYGGTSVTLIAQVTSSVSPNRFTYKWTTGSPAGAAIATTQSITVSPSATTTYFVSVKDSFGCSQTMQLSKQVNVVDIRCGGNKIYVCKFKNGSYTTNCIQATTNNVNNMGAGSYLGQCASQVITARQTMIEEVRPIDEFKIDVFPNPSNSSFNVIIQSSDQTEKVQLKIINIAGQIMEIRNIAPGQSLRIGERYRPGTYLIQVMQGNQTKIAKVIKVSD